MAGSSPPKRRHGSQNAVWELRDVKLESVQVHSSATGNLKATVRPKEITFMKGGLCLASECSWKYVVGLSELEHMNRFLIVKRLINQVTVSWHTGACYAARLLWRCWLCPLDGSRTHVLASTFLTFLSLL